VEDTAQKYGGGSIQLGRRAARVEGVGMRCPLQARVVRSFEAGATAWRSSRSGRSRLPNDAELVRPEVGPA